MSLLKTSIFFFSLLFLLSSCTDDSSSQSTPESTAKSYLSALRKGDLDGASKMGTKRTQAVFDTLKTTINMSTPDEKEALLSSLSISDSSLQCALSAGMMRCTACCDAAGHEVIFVLVQENTQWLIEQDN
jgi:hypothetical protein